MGYDDDTRVYDDVLLNDDSGGDTDEEGLLAEPKPPFEGEEDGEGEYE